MVRGRGSKQAPPNATREAVGCFLMLLLGAIVTLAGLVILLPGLVATLAGKPVPGLGRSVLMWMVAPGIGLAIVAWLTYGLPRRNDPSRRR